MLALACAVATQLAFLYKHRGANEAPCVDVRHPLRSARALFASRWFALGMAIALGAWLLHVVALAFAPLSVVQAVLSTGVVILAVLAERVFGFELGLRQWLGAAMTAGGLLLLVITLPAAQGSHSGYSLAGMISFEAAMLMIGALLISGPKLGAPDHHHGVMLGAAAGTLFGVSDVAIKALTGLSGVAGVIASPWLAIAALASVVAFYASARGMQQGEAVPVIAATSTAANVSCILGGIVVFGDPMPADTLGIVLQGLAFAMVIVAALVTPPPVRAAARVADRSTCYGFGDVPQLVRSGATASTKWTNREGHGRGRGHRHARSAGAGSPSSVDALHPDGALRRRPRGADHRARRGVLRLRQPRQPLPRRPRGAVLREHRARPGRRRPGRRRPGQGARLLHQLVQRAPQVDRAGGAHRRARAGRPQPRVLHVRRLGGGRLRPQALPPVPQADRQPGALQGHRPQARLPRDDDGRAHRDRHPLRAAAVRADLPRLGARAQHEHLPARGRRSRRGDPGADRVRGARRR